ncbi:hypothetical protein EC957_000084 [Mortierella hygrophila]|uniref:Inhibitor I9 domain-containing protein n=1 Tax=Mortierella hygrophila TaxID=979708 RepID=A0A9P6FJ31_9FUNG|nr:hypothetical protein EC957_000047 [Mortierella hygrophila]KAF9552011.1 hypothetical protein EC957_000084 [Mortierella hygrophila]
MSHHKHSHHGHSHDSSAPKPSAAGTNATADALQGSVLPVATPFVGANTAHSLATAPGEAPSTIPKAAGTGAAAASLEGHNKVIVVFKKETPASEIEAAVKDVESKGGKITHRYDAALLGFSAEMPDVSVSSLNSHKHVDYIEPDGEVSIYAKNLLSGDKK